MKIQRIQQQNYHSSNISTKAKRQENNVTFEGLRFRKDGFTAKNCNPSFILKMGAMAGAAAVAVKELVFNNVIGVMTVDQIKERSIEFGKQVADSIYQNNGQVVNKDIEQLVLSNLGEKLSKNIEVAADKDSFCQFCEKHLGFSNDYSAKIYDGIEGVVVPGGLSGKAMFALRLEDKEPHQVANIVAHEFEHLLYKTSGLASAYSSMIVKTEAGKKRAEKNMAQGEAINNKIFELQNILKRDFVGVNDENFYEYQDVEPTLEGFIKTSPILKSKSDLDKKLQNIVRRWLILPNLDFRNFQLLSSYKFALQDEARAYEVGGKVQRYSDELNGRETGKATTSEMVAIAYMEMAKMIAKHGKLLEMNLYKKLLGLPYKDYHEEIPANPVQKAEDSKE